MKRKRLWMVGLFLLGIGVIVFISKRELINAYFSTVKLQFLTNYTQSHYLYDMDETAGLEGVYEGYLEGLGNSMTYYLEKDDLKAAKVQAKGEYFGTGLKLMWNLDGHSLTVVDVVKDSSAERADIKVGDLITEIAEIPVLPANRQDLIKKITSNVKESVSYVIEREGKSWAVDLVPEEVMLDDITWEYIQEVLYMKLNTVKEGTSLRMEQILDETDFTQCKGLILDVRDLMTHQVNEVAKISDLFLERGIAFKVQTKANGVKAFEMSEGAYEMPIVLITNSGTVGGTEALVLALKERATLLGSDTGGLFYIQQIISFEDGTGMCVASGKICDRYGKQLDQEGVSPDIRLYIDDEDRLAKLEHGYLTRDEDNYLKRALEEF